MSLTSLSVPPYGPLKGKGPYGSVLSAGDVTQCPSSWILEGEGPYESVLSASDVTLCPLSAGDVTQCPS